MVTHNRSFNSLVAGFLFAVALAPVVAPQFATAGHWERPTGNPSNTCALPAGSCWRWGKFDGTPTQQDIESYTNAGYYFVYTDAAGGEHFFQPPSLMMVDMQDIGF